MSLNVHTQQYVEWKVYNVTTIKNKYGFRVKLIFQNGSDATQQKGGFTSKKAAEQARTEVIGQLYSNTYVAYRNAIVKHIYPHLGNTKLIKLSRGNVQQFYNKEFKISESVAKLVKTIMNTLMAYALDKKMISVNPTEGVDLPKQKKKTEFRTRHIDEQKTLNQKQMEILIEAVKETPIYLQVMFAVLMGLRRSEIIGVKYSDIDYINRTLHVERQLGKVPMRKKIISLRPTQSRR